MILSFFFFLTSHAQERQISGTVTDEKGETLPGVAVMVRGTETGTVTDINGEFQLSVPNTYDFLVFSYIGMVTKEVQIGTQTTLNIMMEPEAYGLDEIVVVGYGTQRRANLTGSVDMVTSERLEARPITNVSQGLQGLIANLNVTIYSGDPTRSTDLNVRGFESISGGSPLVLVDGVPMDLDRINPQDIESITVLKDAAAGAIYGARAAFGVIMVETKKGEGDTKITFSAEFGGDMPIKNYDYIENGYEFAVLKNFVEVRDGSTPTYSEEYMERLKQYWDDPDNNPSYAVVDGSFENYGFTAPSEELLNIFSPKQKYDLSVSGSTDKANFYSSLSYFNTDGFINLEGNDNFKRINVLMKGDYIVNNWLTFDQQITLNTQISDQSSIPSGRSINRIIRVEPIRPHIVPYIEEYPQYEGMYWDHGLTIFPEYNKGGRSETINKDLWTKSGLTIRPLEGITLRSELAYQFYERDFQRAQPLFDVVSFNLDQPNPINQGGENEISFVKNNNQYYVFNTYATYELADMDSRHYLKGMIGFNQEMGIYERVDADAQEFASQSIINLGATTGLREVDAGKSHTSLRGAFYRLNYIFDDKYLFEANGRYDGTSRFPKDSRFGFFPSFSAGWRVSQENFMAGTNSWLDDLKIRASFGTLGNQLLGGNYYPYIASMNVGTGPFPINGSAISTVSMPGLISPVLTWETVITKNAGLDISLLNQRLNANFDIYTRDTKDMLMRKDYPDILGISSPQENAANLQTRGWEVSVKWRDRFSQDLSYDISFTLSDWVSEITKYENPTGSLNEYYEGQLIGEIWGYETGGIIQDEAQLANIADQSKIGANWRVGDIWYKDLNGDEEISNGINTLDDHGDLRRIGNNNPRYSFGLNAGIKYKNFGLYTFFQGIGKRDYYPSTGNWTWFFPWRSYAIERTWIEDSWSPDNRDAYWPEPQKGTQSYQTQTRYLQNAAYVRLKSLTLSYDLPENILSKINMKGARFYLTGQNLWEYSAIRPPLDPEYVFSGSIDYPLLRTYAFGVQINL